MSIQDKIIHEFKELGSTLLIFIPVWLFFSTFLFELRSIPSESMVPTLQVGDRVAVSKFAYGYSEHSVPFGLGRLLPLGDGRLFARTPERGDIIVFMHTHTNRVMIKRLIGLPGDRIEVSNGRITLNGELLPRENGKWVTYRPYTQNAVVRVEEFTETNPDSVSYQINKFTGLQPGDNTETFVVPEGHLFFMGDNRDNSMDSRDISGHCPPVGGVISEAGCGPIPGRRPEDASIGFVPMDNLIGRAETVLFTLNFCGRYEEGCPSGRVWRGL